MASRSVSTKCMRLAATSNPSQAFLKLTPSRSISTKTPPFQPPLEFLLPFAAQRKLHYGCTSYITSNSRNGPRSFSSSSSKRATVAIVNAKKDEEGNNMTIEITPRASNRLREIMSKDSNPNLALRVTVESGGCHGFQYLMSLTTLPPFNASTSEITEETSPALNTSSSDPNAMSSSPKEQTFDAKEDTVFEADDGSGARVVMDEPSLELLKGSKIDYTEELIGSQFKIVDNPLATSSCGCGTSFDVKIDY